MGLSAYVNPIKTGQNDGAALTNTTTPTSILHAQDKKVLPADFFAGIGYQIGIKMAGRISTVVTTPGTLTLDFRLGGTVIAASSAMTLSTTAKTNVAWWLEVLMCIRGGPGAAATLFTQGFWKSEAAGATTVAGEAKAITWPTSAPAVGNSFDSMAALALDSFATWSVANASNSYQKHLYQVLDIGMG